MNQDEFLRDVDDWCNHRPLLWFALEATAGSEAPVLELGMGRGSTPHLHAYCESRGRRLLSLDSQPEWCAEFAHLGSALHEVRCAGCDWSGFSHDAGQAFSVALVDHAPSERRQFDVEYLVTRCQVIVLHDTEGSMYDGVWRHFPYRADVRTPGACATAVSNTIDVTRWRGQVVGGWGIS